MIKEHNESRDREKERERGKSTHIIIRTTSSILTLAERGKEQWNLRNIGPHLNKVCNEVDSLYSNLIKPTCTEGAFWTQEKTFPLYLYSYWCQTLVNNVALKRQTISCRPLSWSRDVKLSILLLFKSPFNSIISLPTTTRSLVLLSYPINRSNFRTTCGDVGYYIFFPVWPSHWLGHVMLSCLVGQFWFIVVGCGFYQKKKSDLTGQASFRPTTILQLYPIYPPITYQSQPKTQVKFFTHYSSLSQCLSSHDFTTCIRSLISQEIKTQKSAFTR